MVTWLPGSDDSKGLVHDMGKVWIYMGLVRKVMGRPLKFAAQCISQIEAICLCYDNISWQNTAGKPCFGRSTGYVLAMFLNMSWS